VAAHVCAEVPHRQFVFTIPKRLRLYFRFERRLLGELCRAAAHTVITVYRAASGRPDAVPGMTEHNTVGRFPEPGDEELLAGPSRNFQIFDPLDFLAEVTQHIPAPGEHLIRYYGWYSNKTRGHRAQRQPTPAGTGIPARSPTALEARKGWAALIKQVYESDPLTCPKCGTTMRIIAFLERRQTEVIEKILRHCGLWDEPSARAPPAAKVPVTG